MSNTLFVEVGFYLKVTPQIHPMFAPLEFRCSNQACWLQHKIHTNFRTNFCAECGSAIESYKDNQSRSFVRTTHSEDLLPEDLACLTYSMTEESDIWVFGFPLRDDQGKPINQKLEEGDIWDFEINPDEVNRLRECVLEHPEVKNVMDYMLKTYGPGSIEMKYGSVGYYG